MTSEMNSDDLERFKKSLLVPMAEEANILGHIDEAISIRDAEILADPEWTELSYYHQRTLIEAFMIGIVSADELFLPYGLPDDFAGVVNLVADRINRHWGGDEVPSVSLLEFKSLVGLWAGEHPSYRRWCDGPEGVPQPQIVVVTRYDRPASGPPEYRWRVSDEVVRHNAALYLRDYRRLRDD